MKRRSFAVLFLILSLLLLAIPQLSAQNAPAAVIGIRDAGCESQSPQALGALNAAPGLEKSPIRAMPRINPIRRRSRP